MNKKATRNDVIFLYQTLLNRNPEDLDAIKDKIGSSLKELIMQFVSSNEFINRLQNNTPNKIEMNLSEDELFKVFEKTTKQWSKLGDDKSFWSVLTDEHYLPNHIENNLEEFWSTGVKHIEEIMCQLRELGKPIKFSKALELGAGVGRLTFPLSKYVDKIDACDISQGNLANLTKHLKNDQQIEIHHIKNMDFFNRLSSYDLFISLITLQHNAPPVQIYILNKIFESLKINGIAVFQLTIHEPRYEFNLQKYFSEFSDDIDMEMHPLPLTEVFQLVNKHQMRVLQVIQNELSGPNHISFTFIIQK